MNLAGAIFIILSGSLNLFAILFAFVAQKRSLFRHSLLASLFSLASHESVKGGPTGKKVGTDPVEHLLIRSALIALVAIGPAMLLSLLLLAMLLGSNDLSSLHVVRNASFDLDNLYRYTAALWAGMDGVLLLFLTILSMAISLYFLFYLRRKRIPSAATILHAALMESAGLLLLIFHGDTQPFQLFPQDLRVGMGLYPTMMHWSEVARLPLSFLSIAFFYIYVLKASAGKGSSSDRENPSSVGDGKSMPWLSIAWAAAGLSWILMMARNFAMDSTGLVAQARPGDLALLAYLVALTAQLFEGNRPADRRDSYFRGEFLRVITEHVALLVPMAALASAPSWNRTGLEQDSLSTPSSLLFLWIVLSLVFRIATSFLHRGKQDRSSANHAGKISGSLLHRRITEIALYFLSAGALLLAVFAVLLSVPMDCGTMGDSFSCSSIQIPESQIASFTLAALIPALLFATLSLILQGEGKAMRKRILTGGGAALATFFVFVFATGSLFPLPDATGMDTAIRFVYVLVLSFSAAGIAVSLLDLIGYRREPFRPLFQTALYLMAVGLAGYLPGATYNYDFHYYLMMQYPNSDTVQYYSGDKAYVDDFELQAQDIFLHPVLTEAAYGSSRIKFVTAQQATLQLQTGLGMRTMEFPQENVAPYVFANRPFSMQDRITKDLLGYNPTGRLRTENLFYPALDPAKGEVVREGPYGIARRISLPVHDTSTVGYKDLYVQIRQINDPRSGGAVDLNHLYEYFYFDGNKSQEAYYQILPRSVVARIFIRVMPLFKLLWAGTVLFVFTSMLYLILNIEELLPAPQKSRSTQDSERSAQA